jgi:hypothetical protein
MLPVALPPRGAQASLRPRAYNRSMRRVRRAVGLVVIVGVVTAVAGCSMLPGITNESTPTTSAPEAMSTDSAQPTPVPTAAPTTTPQPTPSADAHTQACEALLSVPELYAFNPNFALDSAATAPAGSPASLVDAAGGTLCIYVNLSSKETITLAQASLPADKLLAARDRALASGYTATDVFGTDNGRLGFFSLSKGVGTAQGISASKWTVLSSTWFTAPTDVLKFADPLLAKMG